MKLRLSNLIFYILIIIISLYVLFQVIFPSYTMKYFGFRTLVVMSSSMEPEIKVNDVVIIKSVKEEGLNVRDIITFKVYISELGKKGLVTHYIGKIETLDNGKKIYYTQGASKGPEEYDKWTNESGEPIELTYQDISGKVIFTIPIIGHIIPMFKDPIMVILLVLNVVVIYFIIILIKPSKNSAKETKNTK